MVTSAVTLRGLRETLISPTLNAGIRVELDEWIDTGFRPDGSEMPFERALPRGPMLQLCLLSLSCGPESRYWIMRCNRCRAIFSPDRKPRNRYERGWHCLKCRYTAAAQSATDARRDENRKKWMALAVTAYRDYISKPRRSTHNVSVFVADRVNEKLKPVNWITRNTITRNLKEIEVRAAGKEGD